MMLHGCAHLDVWDAGLLFAAGAAAWSLPLLFVVFTAVCMPWRAVSFYRQKWVSEQRTDRQRCMLEC
jgi:hypothetical protein